MEFPSELRYTKDHEWIRVAGDGSATVGITDFAQHELGDIVFVELEEVDSAFDADEVFGTVEAVKTVSELFMPVTGKIIEINEALEDEPELINNDPYGGGWMIKIELTDAAELDGLMSANDYADMVGD